MTKERAALADRPSEDVQEALIALTRPKSRRRARGHRIDLSFLHLQGAVLHGADLRSARLTGANLEGAGLGKANLEYANLEEVSLAGAMLQGAKLSLAKLRRTDLTNAWLVGADLTGADLHGANLSGSWLVFTDLRGLSGQRELSDITAAQIVGAKLYDTKIPTVIAKEPTVVSTVEANSNLPRDSFYREMRRRIDHAQR